MKKLIALILSLVFVFTFVGCSNVVVEEGFLLKEGKVKRITVSSLPEGYNYSFNGEDAKDIVDYLSALNLESEFDENPNEHDGMTWVIALKYEDGDVLEVYHFGNEFIKVKGGSWYKMTYEEASRFEELIGVTE